MAYIIRVGSASESGTFKDFKADVAAMGPEYDKECGKLMINGESHCEYKAFADETQYV